MLKVKVKLGEGALLPKKNDENDAAYDLFAAEDIYIKVGYSKGNRAIVPTKVSIELPDPCSKWYWRLASKLFGIDRYVYFAFILPRSGMSSKGMSGTSENPKTLKEEEVIVLSSKRKDCDVLIGVVDQPYRGEMGVIMVNRGESFYIPKGTKVAQMIVSRSYCIDEMDIVNELGDSGRGTQGFGSSGV